MGGITGVHCENSGMIAALQAEAKAAGRMGVESHPATRPAAAEAEAIDRLLRLAEVVDIPVIVVHLTCREGYDVIMEARRRGQKVYAETCPQYLLMDDSLYGLAGMEGAKYVCAPPLRKQEDSACLWKALADGTIQTVSTDHCSFTTEQKALGKDDFTKIPGGMPGVETRGTLLYTYGVDAGRITKEKNVPAFVGKSCQAVRNVSRQGSHCSGKRRGHCCHAYRCGGYGYGCGPGTECGLRSFEGRKLTARIESVFLRGTQVVKDHQVVVEKAGKFVKRGRYAL